MQNRIVYFCKPMGMIGPIKIGCSFRPIERLHQLMHWSPVDLEIMVTIPGDLQLEQRIHGIFADHHLRHEWFHPCDALVAGIAKLKAGLSVEEAFDLHGRSRSIRVGSRGKRAPWTECQRYEARLRWARRKLLSAERYFVEPHDVFVILSSWRKTGFVSDDHRARLEDVIANPRAHMVARHNTVLQSQKAPLESEAD